MSTDFTDHYLPDDSERIGTDTRTPGEHSVRETSKEERERRRETIKAGLESAFGEIGKHRYRSAALVIASRIVPALDVSPWDVREADAKLGDTSLPWHPDSLEEVLTRTEWVIRNAPERGDDRATSASSRRVSRLIKEASKSLETLAISQGWVDAELTHSSIVTGHSLPLGIHWQTFDMSLPDPFPVVNRHIHGPMSLAIGQAGSGKSTSVATEALDRYYAGFKVIDLHDSKKLENASYDIPQKQKELRRIRGEMGLPESIDEHPEVEKPDVEILVPLSADLDEQQVLYDEEGEDFRVTPFSVPASELSERVLMAMIPGLSKNPRQAVRQGLDKVSGDWSLRDLAEVISEMGEIESDVKGKAISGIRWLQEQGFVRDKQCPHRIEWEQIFRDTGTITCFSTSIMKSERAKMMVLLYLLHSVYHERSGTMDQFPRAAVVLRELHHVAPTQTNRKENPTEKKIQKLLASEMREIAAERRHTNMEVLADTQHWGQIQRRIREHIDRVLMFQTPAGPAERVFDDVLGDKMRKYTGRVSNFDTGFCAAVAPNRVGGDDTDIKFASPVQFAPPMCHQIDAENESSGWKVRTWYTSDELRDPPEDWAVSLPPRLDFDSADQAIEEKASDEEFRNEDMKEFLGIAVNIDEDAKVAKEDVRGAWRQYCEDEGIDEPGHKTLVGKWVTYWFDDDEIDTNQLTSTSDGRRSAYGGISLSQDGEELLMRWRGDGADDAAEPVVADD